jgi:hypothetical protein
MSLVLVLNKNTGVEQFISRKILNMPAGRHFQFIRAATKEEATADLYDPKKDYPAPQKPVDQADLIKKLLEENAQLKAQAFQQPGDQADKAESQKGGKKSKSISSSNGQDEK